MALNFYGFNIENRADNHAGPDEDITLGFHIDNDTNYKLVSLSLKIFKEIEGTKYYITQQNLAVPVSLVKGSIEHYSVSFTTLSENDTNSIFYYLQSIGDRWASCNIEATYKFDGQSSKTILLEGTDYDLPPGVGVRDRNSGLSIDNFEVERCDSNGTINDEGDHLSVSLKLSIQDNTWLSNMICKLYYKEESGYWNENNSVDLTNKINVLLSNGITRDSTIITSTLDMLSSMDYKLVFGEEAIETIQGFTNTPDSFANLHLSGASTGGVAIGKFSSATEGNPKFESQFPAYFYNGIEEININWIDLTPASGVTTPNSNKYGGGALKVGKVGSHVYIRGSVMAKSGALLCTLPSGYQPWDGNHYKIAPCGGARIARLYVARNGELYLEWVRNLSDGNAYTTAVWVDCAMDFWVYPDEYEPFE